MESFGEQVKGVSDGSFGQECEPRWRCSQAVASG